METFCLDPSLDAGLRADIPAASDHPAADSLPINDITCAVQWLGAHTGTPAVFVRTQGCSLACKFCDVPETWREAQPMGELKSSPEGKLWSRGQERRHRVVRWRYLTPEGVVNWCRQNYRQRHIVVTGGEPAMHPMLGPLCEALCAAGYAVQVETSGTYAIAVPEAAWVSVSPKIGQGRTLVASTLARANEIVMPVSKAGDLVDLAQRVVPELSARCRIYLHPIRGDAAAAKAVESAFNLGYRVTSAAWVRE